MQADNSKRVSKILIKIYTVLFEYRARNNYLRLYRIAEKHHVICEKGGGAFHVKITCKRIEAQRIMGHLAIRTNIFLLGDHIEDGGVEQW